MSSWDGREKPVVARRLLPGLIGIVVVLSAALTGSSTVLPASAESVITQLGGDINGEAVWDESGFSVSLSSDGTRVAIGALGNAGNGTRSGHTRIYEYDSINGWTQLGTDINGEAAGDESGYSVALSADGTRVAIGAPGNAGNGTRSGHTRIYEYDSINGWTQLGADINGEAVWDESGYSVALSADGTRVAIGAPGNGDGGFLSGHSRIYEYDDINGWTQLGADIDGEAAGDSEAGGEESGYSVALSADGTRVAIGAPGNDGGGDTSGHSRIYEYDSINGWTQLGTDIDGEAANDSSGYSVSLSGDGTRVAIGAYGNDDGDPESGHTRIFRITAVTQDSQRESSENPGPPGIFLTLTTHTPQPSHGYTVTFGAYAIAPNSPYVITIRNEQTGTQRILTSATVSPGGHLEKSTQLPQLEAGSHTITVSARSNTGALLTLGNRIVVDGQGNIHSVSPEQLQPSIR
jgi:hypothetical protein